MGGSAARPTGSWWDTSLPRPRMAGPSPSCVTEIASRSTSTPGPSTSTPTWRPGEARSSRRSRAIERAFSRNTRSSSVRLVGARSPAEEALYAERTLEVPRRRGNWMLGVVELASVSSEVVEQRALLLEAVPRRRDHLEVEVGVVADERGERLPQIVVGATDASREGAVVAEDEDSGRTGSAGLEDRRLEPMRRALGVLERVRRTV